MNGRRLRCGVIGVGRMGRHHARVYAQLPDAELVGVVDANPQTRQSIVEQLGGRAFENVEQLIDAGVDAVTIATPTIHHRSASETLLRARVACLIEKPLAPNIEEARAIADAAAASNTVLQVGHIVRYDPVMVAIRQLPDLSPRFIEMDRISPMTFRSVDVGVVLDMMIHDLDLLLMLVGCEPCEVQASAVSVLGEAEDVCNARLTFDLKQPQMNADERRNGNEIGVDPRLSAIPKCVANVTASRLALKTERKIRIISEDTYISADFVARSGTVMRKTANQKQLSELRERIKSGEDLSDVDYRTLVQSEPLNVGNGEPLKLQIEDFLSAVRSGRRPTVDAEAGFAAVRTAERIVAAAKAAGSQMV
jgi:predicted dehydrogenase